MIMLRFTLISARFFTVLLIVCVYDAYANIVYVHLSAQLPPYVHVALEQARLFNPHTDIYLIANLRALDLSQDILEKSNIIAIPAEKLAPSKYHQRFNRSNTFDNKIRDGFWKKATERFFYIHELMVARALTSVVQVESDNMLYVNIAEIQSG